MSSRFAITGRITRIGVVSTNTCAVEVFVDHIGAQTYYITARNFDSFADWIGYTPDDPNPNVRCTLAIENEYIQGWR